MLDVQDALVLVASWCHVPSLCSVRAACRAFLDAVHSESKLWEWILHDFQARLPGKTSAMNMALSIAEARARCKPMLQASPRLTQAPAVEYDLLIVGHSMQKVGAALQFLSFGRIRLPRARLAGLDVRAARTDVKADVFGELSLEKNDLVEVVSDPDRQYGVRGRRAYGLNVRSGQLGWFTMSDTDNLKCFRKLDGECIEIRINTAWADKSVEVCKQAACFQESMLHGHCGCLILGNDLKAIASQIGHLKEAIGSTVFEAMPKVATIYGSLATSDTLQKLSDDLSMACIASDFNEPQQLELALALLASQFCISL